MRGAAAIILSFTLMIACGTGHAKTQRAKEHTLPAGVDHLVYATPNLAAGIAQVEHLLGVKAIPGGQHPGGGTRNALVGLGRETYREIIGPDPEQPNPALPRRFTIDTLKESKLVTWAEKSSDLESLVAKARSHNIDLGRVQDGSRKRPDGVLLAWRLTVSPALTADGIVPFFIDWGKTPHPAAPLPPGCELISLSAKHPDAKRVQDMLTALGLNMRVDSGSTPELIATIRTPKGEVELR